MAQGRRVVVTGLGTVCPNGNDVLSAWESVINGNSGAELIDKFDTSEFSTKFGATVKDFENKYPSQGKVPRPDYWSGWRLIPNQIEFWLDGEGRIHERLVYLKEKEKWVKKLLYP